MHDRERVLIGELALPSPLREGRRQAFGFDHPADDPPVVVDDRAVGTAAGGVLDPLWNEHGEPGHDQREPDQDHGQDSRPADAKVLSP